MQDQEIINLVTIAFASFPNMQEKDPEPVIKVWKMLLNDMPYQLAERALAKVLMTTKFFPTVADIRETAMAFATKELKPPDEAWLEVLEKVNRYITPAYSSPEIHEAVRTVGYLNICDSENIGVERAHFLKIYEAIMKRKKDNFIDGRVTALLGEVVNQIEDKQVTK